MTQISKQAHELAKDLLNFIDASPSPWHAVNCVEQRLLKQGFTQLDETQSWQLAAGKSYFVTRGGASIIAFTLGKKPLPDTGLRIVGAHTDSPSLTTQAASGFWQRRVGKDRR